MPPPTPESVTRYHLSPAVSVLAFGGRALVLGVAVLICVLLKAVGDQATALAVLFWLCVVAAVILAFALLAAALRLLRHPVLLRLDADGYSVRGVRGAGVRSAPWTAVERAESSELPGQRGVDLVLRDGRRTTLPSRLFAEPMAVWVADLDARLNHAYGQRRL